ncbi:MAG: DUF3379 domain-containing protein [Gammaproteobacteria bacterium]|nr:DUF3379 domain-containing protein [Gammaproteobacteria bacterium]
MMDDLEFRRRCIADPFERDEAFLLKAQETPDYARMVERQGRLDRKISEIMHDVEIPEGLQARIQLRHSLQQNQFNWLWWRRSFALAASVILTVSIVFLMLQPRPTLQEVVLSHVYDELHHLNEQNQVSDAQLGNLLNAAGGFLKGELGRVNYAGSCKIRNRKGVHLVLQSNAGPVTLLLMPGVHAAQRAVIEDTRFKGYVLPIPDGSMAILGDTKESLQGIERKVLGSVGWGVKL